MEVKFTHCKRNMFSGYSLMHFHQSTHPWDPLSYQDREHFHLSRKIARSHFVLKLLASERFCVEIIKAKCVGREPNHLLQTQVVMVLETGPEPARTRLQGWALK